MRPTRTASRSFRLLLTAVLLAAVGIVGSLLWSQGHGPFHGDAAAAQEAPVFLIIDEDSIDNGTSSIEGISLSSPFCGAGDPATCVNDDIVRDAGNGLTTPLFSRGKNITPFNGLVLPTGQLFDEALFSVGLPDPDLKAFIRDTLPNFRLDGIPGSPLQAADIRALKGKTVCAKVKDSDVSDLGGGKLNAQGDYMGLTAFTVVDVLGPGNLPESRSGSSLPDILVNLVPSTEVLEVCDPGAPPPPVSPPPVSPPPEAPSAPPEVPPEAALPVPAPEAALPSALPPTGSAPASGNDASFPWLYVAVAGALLATGAALTLLRARR